jgi:hypothetical protein
MTGTSKALCAGFLLCLIASVIVALARPPLDSYLIEYADECLLKRGCPIIDCAPSSTDPCIFPVVPRQVRLIRDGTGFLIVSPRELPVIDFDRYMNARENRKRSPEAAGTLGGK